MSNELPPEFAGLDAEIAEVGTLEIVRPAGDGFHDGYPTILKVDGKKLPERELPWYEERIVLIAEAGCRLAVAAWVRGVRPGPDAARKIVIFCPQQFDLTLGCVRVRARPDRYPCQITVNEFELLVKCLRVEFVEGKAVWVEMEFLPVGEVVADEPIVQGGT